MHQRHQNRRVKIKKLQEPSEQTSLTHQIRWGLCIAGHVGPRALLASGVGVCRLFTKHLAGGQIQHLTKASGFCLFSVAIMQGQRTIHSHYTLMQLSCLCCHRSFVFNKGGDGVVTFILLCYYFSTTDYSRSPSKTRQELLPEMLRHISGIGAISIHRLSWTDRSTKECDH